MKPTSMRICLPAPVLLTVGGAALVVHQINQRTADGHADEAESARDQSPPKRSTATKRAAPAKRSSTAKSSLPHGTMTIG